MNFNDDPKTFFETISAAHGCWITYYDPKRLVVEFDGQKKDLEELVLSRKTSENERNAKRCGSRLASDVAPERQGTAAA